MSAEHPGLDPRVEDWVATVYHYWRRRGLSDPDRAQLRADLERDCRLALAEGATIDELTDADPDEFARELAEAAGLGYGVLRADPSMTATSFLVSALVGAVAGCIASLLLIYPIGTRLLDHLPLTDAGEGVFAIGLHVVAACACTASAMGALRWRFRFHVGILRTTLLAGLFLLLGGAVSVAPTMALAASLGYSTAAHVVLQELGIVFAFCLSGLLTAFWIGTRPSRPTRVDESTAAPSR
ncbi:hypothetical protein [Nocardioides sp.]|uniref:hypothetical protein n=1 Tax=Nocardioides sp. TaxID=35761 RepID=UPI00273474E6|nr:hypothetical protein [Nocardioides sp.]MDP3890739.1 hypothetical protein [Nocardioides sp.]